VRAQRSAGALRKPSCKGRGTTARGDQPVGFTTWEEFHQTGGVWYGTSATWEGEPGTDTELMALARDANAQLEQLRALRSIQR
jgi:hypothetical protein